MNDDKIIDLYFERSESAISETKTKYGGYCHTIAYRILLSNDGAEECVDDTCVILAFVLYGHYIKTVAYFM